MIDLHTHILPGVDDGSPDMEESIRMVRIAYESGVHTLAVTPHCNMKGIFENYYDALLQELYTTLEREVKRADIPIKLVLGMEVYGDEELPNLLRSGKLATINRSRYLLLEIGFHEGAMLMDYLIEEILQLGYLPIIAHPERYLFVQKHPDIVMQWLEQGCCIQLNKGSIMGSFGFNARNTAMYFLEYNLASMIASDAHSSLQRSTDMSKVYSFMKGKFDVEYANILLQENPNRILEDKDIIRVSRRGVPKKSLFY